MNAGRILFGSVVTAFGVIFLLGSVGVLSPGEVIGAWWPLAIVLLGVLHAGSGGRLSGGSLALVIVGAALLGVTTGLFGSDAWRIQLFFAALLTLTLTAAWQITRWWHQFEPGKFSNEG